MKTEGSCDAAVCLCGCVYAHGLRQGGTHLAEGSREARRNFGEGSQKGGSLRGGRWASGSKAEKNWVAYSLALGGRISCHGKYIRMEVSLLSPVCCMRSTRSHMYGCIENVEENVWGFLPLLTRAFLASCFRQHIFKTLQ